MYSLQIAAPPVGLTLVVRRVSVVAHAVDEEEALEGGHPVPDVPDDSLRRLVPVRGQVVLASSGMALIISL
jgi:hypothetical protein